jgi:hypothetical protein
MWASGETDEPKKISSGAWLLRALEEIDERRCWTTWTFKGGFAGVFQFGFVFPCVHLLPVHVPAYAGPVIYPLSIKH